MCNNDKCQEHLETISEPKLNQWQWIVSLLVLCSITLVIFRYSLEDWVGFGIVLAVLILPCFGWCFASCKYKFICWKFGFLYTGIVLIGVILA